MLGNFESFANLISLFQLSIRELITMIDVSSSGASNTSIAPPTSNKLSNEIQKMLDGSMQS